MLLCESVGVECPYTLVVKYTPFAADGLFQNFSLDLTYYIIIFLLIFGVLTLAFVLVWMFHRLFTRLRYPPDFRFKPFLEVLAPPVALGFVCSMLPATIGVCILLFLRVLSVLVRLR